MSSRDRSEAILVSSVKITAGGLEANFSKRRAAALWQAAAAELARPVDLESVESRASHPSRSALAILQPVVAAESWPAARVWLGRRAARNSMPAQNG